MGGAKPIRLVADPYPPYQYEEGGEVKGLDHDLVVTTFHSLGRETFVELLPWEECLKRIEEGKADGVFQVTKTPEREEKFLFPSEPLRTAKTVLLAKPGLPLRRITPNVDLVAQLRPFKLGVLSGYSYGAPLDELPSALKIPVATQEELLFRLAKGDFQLAVIDLGVALYLSCKLNLRGISPIKGFSIKRDLFIVFNPRLENLARSFGHQLKELKRQGILNSLSERYGLTVY